MTGGVKMSDLTAFKMFEQAVQLYQQDQYKQAYDLLTREGPRFPESAERAYFLRMFLACCLGQTDLAIDLLAEAVQAGYWYVEEELQARYDELQPLRGTPRFEQLAAICLERQQAAEAKTPLMRKVIEPTSAGESRWPLIMALHGMGQSADQAAKDWQPAAEVGWLVAALQSAQGDPASGYIWLDRGWALRDIRKHYDELIAQYPIDPNRVIIVGFSKGARLAIEAALAQTIRVPALSPSPPGWKILRSGRLAGDGYSNLAAATVCVAISSPATRTIPALLSIPRLWPD
jgi:tetratricopeptide (TPR) repeat protein